MLVLVFKRPVGALSTGAGYLSFAAILGAMVIILYEVAVRYVLRWPTDWEIEASIILTTFVTFVGSAYALKNDAHIRMDFLTAHLPAAWQRGVHALTSAASLLFCGWVTYRSWQMFWEAFSAGWRSETTWGPPLAVPYGFMASGMTLVTLQYLALLLAGLAGCREEVRHHG